MQSVAERIVDEYKKYFAQLRLEIDLFQQIKLNEISSLEALGEKAEKEDFMPTYQAFKETLNHGRLFALIDAQGQGVLKHITGNFLPACEEEVRTTIADGTQEQLFLHYSGKQVHFDLLQPLATKTGQGKFFFAAFNTNVLQEILIKYQLPHQQLFIMRSDKQGNIELTTEQDSYQQMTIAESEFQSFSFIEPLPGTRWQLAIRLDPAYSENLFFWSIFRALLIWLALTIAIVLFYQGQKKRLLTHRKISSELKFKDTHDKLTGLANRKKFNVLLEEQLTVKNNSSESVEGVALHVDLDKFQVINNSFGYVVGDRLLLELSSSLKTFVPKNATISRIGSDEFAILLPDLHHAEAKALAHEIRMAIQDINITEENKETYLSASIGVVNLGEETLIDCEQVFSSLSLCVRLAKKKGGNRVVNYRSDDPQLKQHSDEMDAIHLITDAIKRKRFVLFRQEILSLGNAKEEKHYEMLVRIKDANGELVYPNDFIPAAEKYGLIKKVDKAVIEATLTMMSQQDTLSSYSINLSGATLGDRDIIEFVHQIFEKTGVDPKRVCFEITETSAISHLNSALVFMKQMIDLGCIFALDDFGSGLSSFSYLQQLPVAIIKIDGSFVRDIDNNAINRIFVENIQRTAKAMNKKTVAEFVETADIEKILTEIGINYGQGYHIHKPEKCYE